MKKYFSRYSMLSVLVVGLIFFGSRAYADDASQFTKLIKDVTVHRALLESELGLDPNANHYYPHATCYYDDLVDHYEQDELVRDSLGPGNYSF